MNQLTVLRISRESFITGKENPALTPMIAFAASLLQIPVLSCTMSTEDLCKFWGPYWFSCLCSKRGRYLSHPL